MEITTFIPENMIKSMDDFFGKKNVNDIDRNTFLTLGMRDNRYNLDIVMFFMKDWHGDYNSYEQMSIEGKGSIFVFPSYWISVPKPLVMSYMIYILEDFYKNVVSGWGLGFNYADQSGGLCGDNPTLCPCC